MHNLTQIPSRGHNISYISEPRSQYLTQIQQIYQIGYLTDCDTGKKLFLKN